VSFGSPIYSVLHVDPDQKRRDAFESAFRGEYHIFSANSAEAALELMEQRTIQLVIAELKLPLMGGIRFLEKVMAEHPYCTRMVQIREGEMDEIMPAVDRGIVFGVVALPWKRNDLKIIIDGALEVYYLKVQNRNLEKHLEEVKKTLERKVMERTGKIERQRINITDSIQYASRIQKALMLSPLEMKTLLPSHFLLNKPKDIVSGDFYWVSRKNDRLILAVADSTGHGVPGAFMSILGINLLNEIVNDMEELRAGDILSELRTQLIRALGQTGEMDETREGMEMALCVIDTSGKVIQFSGAGRLLYMVREGELTEIKGDRIPIGIYGEEEKPFSNQEIPFRENDLVYFFTDGYVDQIGGLKRKTFRTARFRKLITEICHLDLEEQRAILREEHEIWRAGQEQIDDIMVLGIRL